MRKKRAALTSVFYAFSGGAFLLCLLARGDVCLPAARDALRYCGESLIPALFPFIAAGGILMGSGAAELTAGTVGRAARRFFRIPPSLCAPYLIGLVAGFPSGAAAVARVYANGGCTKDDAERALPAVSNAGAGFVCAGIGSLLGGIRYGAAIYAAQTVISLAAARILFRRSEHKEYPRSGPSVASGTFTQSVKSAAIAVINVCAFAVFFAPVSALAVRGLEYAGASGAVKAAAASVLELTNGARTAALLSPPLSAAVCGFAASWSGLCVAAQISSVAADAGLSMKYYFPCKLISGAVCGICVYAASVLFF